MAFKRDRNPFKKGFSTQESNPPYRMPFQAKPFSIRNSQKGGDMRNALLTSNSLKNSHSLPFKFPTEKCPF